MRIAYVLTSLGVGGAERQVLALAERMKARGHVVLLVVLLPRQAEEWPTALDLLRLEMRKRPLSLLAGAWKARRSLKEFQPDLIHSHTFPANMIARLLRLSGLAPVLSTIHNVYEGGWGRMLAYRLTDGLSRRTTAVSQAAADRFAHLKAVPARKLSVLVNGIDTAEFAPSPERRSKMREEMSAGDEFIWLAAGRIVAAKDYPNLLRAFAQARAAIAGARLWIAGEASEIGGKQPAGANQATEKPGKVSENVEKHPSVAKANIDSIGVTRGLKPPSPSESSFSAACKALFDFAVLPARLKSCPGTKPVSDSASAKSCAKKESAWTGRPTLQSARRPALQCDAIPARLKSCPDTSCAKTCESLVSELELGASVFWLGLRRDMPALLDAADGFVLASAWEGMPLAVGEAMAMEKPVVATDVGGVRELLGETGAIVPAKSPEALAEAMVELMRSTLEERHALGHAARERIATHFSIDAKADEWEALYRTIAQPPC